MARRRKFLYPFSTRSKGFTLVEIAMAMFVFGMMIVLLGALFPAAARGGHSGSNYSQAALLAQHKIDQVRQGSFTKLTASQMAGLKITDSNPAGSPMTATTPAGLPAGTTSYSFTTVDNLVDNGANLGYFPAGAQGILSLSPALSAMGSNAPPTSQALQVTVTITWMNGAQPAGATNQSVFSTHTIIARY